MSNKVVKIGSSKKSNSLEDEIVYSDIAMTCEYTGRVRKQKVGVLKEKKLKVQNDQPLQNDDFNTFVVDVTKTEEVEYGENRRLKKSVNVRAVQNSLDNIFSWIPGERIINPEFGTKLHEYLYEGITQYNEEMIVAEIKSCIARWEPRVVVTQVVNTSTLSDTEDNTIVLDIKYYIKNLPDRIFDKQYIFNRSM